LIAIPEHQNLFVLYPPGVGGNHLANMLSLSDDYITRFDLSKYDRPINFQGNIVAHHFSTVPQLDVKIVTDNLETLSKQNNVFACHWLKYHIFKQSGLLKHFPNRRYVVIQVPEEDSRAFLRLQKAGLGHENFPWLLHEIRTLYKINCLALVCEEPLSSFYSVWPDMLFDQDFGAIIKDLEDHEFKINLDVNLVQSFHDKWLTNIQKEMSL
jgi:hypothetical protein